MSVSTALSALKDFGDFRKRHSKRYKKVICSASAVALQIYEYFLKQNYYSGKLNYYGD